MIGEVIILQVPDENCRPPLSQIGFKDVALDNGEPVVFAKLLPEVVDQVGIYLNSDDACRAIEQVFCESAFAGTDLDDSTGGFPGSGGSDLFEY